MTTKAIRIWQKMTFWDKLERSMSLIAGIVLVELGIHDAPNWAFITLGAIGIVAKLVHIWVEDVDGDGIADIFQRKDEIKPE